MPSILTALDPIDGEAVVSMAVCRAQLRVDGNDDDALIRSMLNAAVEMVERETGKGLSVRSWRWETARFVAQLRPSIGPLVAVTAVRYRDDSGAAASLDAAEWRMGNGGVSAVADRGWPTGSEVAVEFTAGFSAPPPALVAAVQLTLGHLYRNREAVVVGTITATLPIGVEALCAPFRDARIG